MSTTLIIRACAIGDFVLNLPALHAVRKTWPDKALTLVGYPSTLELAREFIPVERIYSIESPPWSRLFQEPVSGLEFDCAIVWMKDPVLAENLRGSGIRDIVSADPFPSYGHAATHLLRTLKLGAPPLPDFWQPQSERIVIHAGSGSPRKNWPDVFRMSLIFSDPMTRASPGGRFCPFPRFSNSSAAAGPTSATIPALPTSLHTLVVPPLLSSVPPIRASGDRSAAALVSFGRQS